MSGADYNSPCPKCGADMNCYVDWKPYDTVRGQCLECGFSYRTEQIQMTLKQVNRQREEFGLPPLTRLKPQAS